MIASWALRGEFLWSIQLAIKMGHDQVKQGFERQFHWGERFNDEVIAADLGGFQPAL